MARYRRSRKVYPWYKDKRYPALIKQNRTQVEERYDFNEAVLGQTVRDQNTAQAVTPRTVSSL